MKLFLHDSLADVILPERCSVCGDPLLFNRKDAAPVCRDCCAGFVPVAGERCSICGMPLVSEHGTCLRCREVSPWFDGNIPVFTYSPFMAGIISRYKNRGQKRLAPVFADFLYETYRTYFSGVPVVPVPFRPASRKKRGWDQVEEILRVLVRRRGIRALHLLRRDDGVPQKSLSYEERLRNLEGTIHLREPSAGEKNRYRELPRVAVLLDDVFTTGATVNECARVLKAHGLAKVYSMTVAIDP